MSTVAILIDSGYNNKNSSSYTDNNANGYNNGNSGIYTYSW